jgi:hypothetical protein
MQQEIKEKYSKIQDKPAFRELLSSKLGVSRFSLEQYFVKTDNVPKKHEERVLNALNIQLARDRNTKELTVKDWEIV